MDSPYRTPDPPDSSGSNSVPSRSDRRCSPIVYRECPSRADERAGWEGWHRALSAVLLLALAGASGVALLGGVGVIAEAVRMATTRPVLLTCAPPASAAAARSERARAGVAGLLASTVPRTHDPEELFERAWHLRVAGLPLERAEVRFSGALSDVAEIVRAASPDASGASSASSAPPSGSLAELVGFRAGDVITAVDGYAPREWALREADRSDPGRAVVELDRGGRHYVLMLRWMP